MSAIVVNSFNKKFNGVSLRDLNLEILDGEFFALLGDENSGNTILGKVIFNFLKSQRGSVRVFDLDPSSDSKEIKQYCAYSPKEIYFDDNPKAITVFKNTLKTHNLKTTDELEYLLEYFNFDERQKVNDMEDCDRRIFSIINALIVKPRLAVMEYMTDGLPKDVVAKLFAYLENKREEEGLTLLFVSGDYENAQRYCDRVAVMEEGQVKEVTYVKDKLSNDKIFRIYHENIDMERFDSIGCVPIYRGKDYSELYFNGDASLLVSLIANEDIKDFTIEDADLSQKIRAMNSGSKYKAPVSASKEEIEMAYEYETSQTDASDSDEAIGDTEVIGSVDVEADDEILLDEASEDDDTQVLNDIDNTGGGKEWQYLEVKLKVH